MQHLQSYDLFITTVELAHTNRKFDPTVSNLPLLIVCDTSHRNYQRSAVVVIFIHRNTTTPNLRPRSSE
ncbi:hypothetical protein L1987_49549 [Smallanthus sonchifolius]|uniref:Uncharacterized protein n=1 Tax=Smallanthus sonchifolius TaxID=185202 RepID=A0ACB9FV20_9ASTR|nr:hypothetical protein L1987_49549 [Smallanthus sonchifolius]